VVVINNAAGSAGGGVYNAGILTLQDSLVASNVITGTDFSPSLQEGAGIYNTGDEGEFGSRQGTLSIIDSQIIDNHNAGSSGGGIHSGGTLRIDGSSISGNRTGSFGGGIFSAGDVLTIADSRIRNNISENYGGGIYKVRGVGEIDGSVIQGNQALGTGLAGGGGIWNERTLRINASVISDNHTEGRGGGLRSSTFVNDEVVLVRDTTIHNNSAVREGGGLSLSGNGSVQIVGSTLSDNQTSGDGGGILNSHEQVAVTNSTVSNNQADGRGGGIANVFACDSVFARTVTSVLTTTSSTLYGNQAAQGGGIYQRPLDVAADDDDGCANDTITSSLTLMQSIVASNVVTETGSDCAGPVSSGGFNLLGDTSGCTLTGDTASTIISDPALGTLDDNGGPTRTHQPLSGSPAIDAIPAATCATDADQRGLSRPQAANCDIGSIEAGDLPPDEPTLALNFATGSPGSIFTLRGDHLPARRAATLSINGESISGTYTTDAAGHLVLLLDTTNADPGTYTVQVQLDPNVAQTLDLRASFDLRPNGVPRAAEADGATPQIAVPAGIGDAVDDVERVYLPLVWRSS
jgi:hypothetical protein